MDDAFRRRFPVQIRFELPDEDPRRRIWKLSLVDAPLAPSVDLAILAKEKMSGGSIQKIACTAAAEAAVNGTAVKQEYLEDALNEELEALGRVRWTGSKG
jgi:AAA+ superfamily predicted ATPase